MQRQKANYEGEVWLDLSQATVVRQLELIGYVEEKEEAQYAFDADGHLLLVISGGGLTRAIRL